MSHETYNRILKERGLQKPTTPLWTLKLTSEEIIQLQQYIKDNPYNCGKEAMLYYSYWWQKCYAGGSPSKEEIALSIGEGMSFYSEDIYKSAKTELGEILRVNGDSFIKTTRTEYFRTLLSQGGLPIKFIQSNMGAYKRFLIGLVRELSYKNDVDWRNSGIIKNMSCITWLPGSFQDNDSILDVSFRIAQAIIQEKEELLPYDTNESTLKDLTQSLKNEHQRIERAKQMKPFAFRWYAFINENNKMSLRYSLDCGNIVSSANIQGLNKDCSQFDVFVDQQFVATYKLFKTIKDDDVDIIGLEYRCQRQNKKLFEWKGEVMLDVKVTYQGVQYNQTVANSCPPNFHIPQIFHKESESLYQHIQKKAAGEAIIVFESNWSGDNIDTKVLTLAENEYKYIKPSDNVILHDSITGEQWEYENVGEPYNVELSGIYIPWVEYASHKLLSRVPYVKLSSQENKPLQYKIFYRIKGGEWTPIKPLAKLPVGLIDLKIQPEDRLQAWCESFYSIQDLNYDIIASSEESATIKWTHNMFNTVDSKNKEGITINKLSSEQFEIDSEIGSHIFQESIDFEFRNNPLERPLQIAVANPLSGTVLINGDNQKVSDEEIIAFDNLRRYKIISYGGTTTVKLSFFDPAAEEKAISIPLPINNGITPLSNFEDAIDALFNLYGANSFDRKRGVTLAVSGQIFTIRKFVFDTYQPSENRYIIGIKGIESQENIAYCGNIYAYRVDNHSENEAKIIKLERVSDYTFKFPHEDNTSSYIIFSDRFDEKRIVPKFYKVLSLEDMGSVTGFTKDGTTEQWIEWLTEENALTGIHWKKTIEAFRAASHYRLPFSTFNQIRAVASKSILFAKFVLAIYTSDIKDLLPQELIRLELDFGFGIHWLRDNDIENSLMDLNVYAQQIQHYLYRGYPSFICNLVGQDLSNECADKVCNNIMRSMIPAEHKKVPISLCNEICSRAYGRTDNGSDMPSYKINIPRKYYEVSGKRSYHYTLLNCPIVTYEHCKKISDNDLWNENEALRRIINYYRIYYNPAFCMMLKYLFDN